MMETDGAFRLYFALISLIVLYVTGAYDDGPNGASSLKIKGAVESQVVL